MITQLIKTAEVELASLGTDPSELTPQAVLADISTKLKSKWPTAPTLPLSDVTAPRNSREAAEQASSITIEFEKILSSVADTTKPMCAAEVVHAISTAFDDVLPLRLARFAEAKRILCSAAESELVRNLRSHADVITLNARTEMRIALRSSRRGATAEVAAGVVTDVMYSCVYPAMEVAKKLSTDAAWIAEKSRSRSFLAESVDHAKAREKAAQKIKQLREAAKVVTCIERHVNTDADDASKHGDDNLDPTAHSAAAGHKRSRAVVSVD